MEETIQIIERAIREKNKSGQLAQLEELWTEVTSQGFFDPEEPQHRSHFEEALGLLVTENGDIREISGQNRIPRYYSSLIFTETYASILARKEDNSLIAEIVRENSSIYPRPIPLDIFREPPFELTREQIFNSLREMSEQEDYQDIVQTTTSIGTIFLYSNQHLDPVYAATLAEWLDVGEANNP